MKRILLLLTLLTLFCTLVFAEQREKFKVATEYTKFFAQKVKSYSAYRAVSPEELRKEFRNGNALYEININYFGSIVCRSKILAFKKFIKELPESGKVGFVVTVDRKQEYQKVYFEVLDEIYEYLYACRKRSKTAEDKLDNELPYFVICIAKGRYDEKIIPNIDTTSTVEQAEFDELPMVEEKDSVVEVVVPQEVTKVKPKKKAKEKIVAEPQVVPDDSENYDEYKEPIVLGLVVVTLLIIVLVLKKRRKNKK